MIIIIAAFLILEMHSRYFNPQIGYITAILSQ
jgi:hypothetical protein